MASAQKKAAVLAIRARYKDQWFVAVTPVGMELSRQVNPDLKQHVFFNFVRDDDSFGLRVQPAIGVTFSSVNLARDSIIQPHEFNANSVTAFVLLNGLLDPHMRSAEGWEFNGPEDVNRSFGNFLNFVDTEIEKSKFFELLTTVDEYIEAVESSRWPLFSVLPTYLYALISKGRVETAKLFAAEHREKLIKIAQERGYVVYPDDLAPYDAIIGIN